MKDKKPLLIGAALLALLAVFAWPHLRWLQFRLDANAAIGDKGLGRFPTGEQLIAFPETLRGLAKAKGFDDLEVTPALEERGVGPTAFWYYRTQLRAGSQALVLERRIETRVDRGLLEQLAEAGVKIEREKAD